MKILIIGGHLSPALSVIENLTNDTVFYVGRKYPLEGDKALSLEYQTITKLNIEFFEITTARLQRAISRHTFLSLARLPKGFFQAIKILKTTDPDVVLGFGGYLCVPVVMAAFVLKIPVVLHEQTLEAGLANKLLAKFAEKVCISWESSRNFFPKDKTILTGLPLKKEIIVAKQNGPKEGKPTIYITGGSLGSHTINTLVLKNLPILLKNYNLIHQTGDARSFNDFDALENIKNTLPKELADKYTLKKFLTTKEVLESIQNADIVVSRSGINTVCELIFLEKPAFLIPLSFSQRSEQLKNALFAKSLNLAEVGDEKILTPEEFVSTINKMFKEKHLYKKALEKNVINKDAALKVIKVLNDVSKKKET